MVLLFLKNVFQVMYTPTRSAKGLEPFWPLFSTFLPFFVFYLSDLGISGKFYYMTPVKLFMLLWSTWPLILPKSQKFSKSAYFDELKKKWHQLLFSVHWLLAGLLTNPIEKWSFFSGKIYKWCHQKWWCNQHFFVRINSV